VRNTITVENIDAVSPGPVDFSSDFLVVRTALFGRNGLQVW
jgi:hypothetical protein